MIPRLRRLLGVLPYALAAACDAPPTPPQVHDHAPPPRDLIYTCPMHPSVRASQPGKCPICGMDLALVRGRADGSVTLDEPTRDTWGIRTTPAELRPMTHHVRLAGPVGWDLRRQRDVVVRATGTASNVRVAVGTPVRAGEALFWLRSPELFAAQRDALGAPPGGRDSAASRLHTLGMTPQQVEAMVKTGAPLDAVPILAPMSGVVTDVSVVDGSPIDAWSAPVRIADPDRVWVEASTAEAEGSLIVAGALAEIRVDTAPDRTFRGTLTPIPSRDAIQRFRVEVVDTAGLLSPGQIAVVDVAIVSTPAVVVPADAVIYAGTRRVVFVDAGDGRLDLREVTVTSRDDDEVALSAGVTAGERVVRDGAFLVASESRLRAPEVWTAPAEPAGP